MLCFWIVMIESLEAFRRHRRIDAVDGPSLVIVGVDGSDSAWRAFAWASGHARRSGCPVLVIYALPPTGLAELVSTPPVIDAVWRAQREIADDIHDQVARVAADLNVPVRFEHHQGDPGRVLLAAAEEHAADMLVLGASMQSVHRIAGSLPSRLVRCRRLPVVVIP
jgi:nucleotide-binding universal stress UspA family protein